MTNLNLAFDIAEQHLDIPKMLDAEGKNPDMSGQPMFADFRVVQDAYNCIGYFLSASFWVVQSKAILFLKSMSERVGSDIERR